jgi:hypothetical protein
MSAIDLSQWKSSPNFLHLRKDILVGWKLSILCKQLLLLRRQFLQRLKSIKTRPSLAMIDSTYADVDLVTLRGEHDDLSYEIEFRASARMMVESAIWSLGKRWVVWVVGLFPDVIRSSNEPRDIIKTRKHCRTMECTSQV